MKSSTHTLRSAVLAVTLLAAAVPFAAAGDKLDTDIDKLKAQLRLEGDEWALAVEAKVEFEGRIPAGDKALVLHLAESGRTILDLDGEAVEIVIPLEQPSDVDGDELEYEEEFTAYLPASTIQDPFNVRVRAAVYLDGIERPLDAKETLAFFDQPRPEPVVVIEPSIEMHHVSSGIHRTIVHRSVYAAPTYCEPRPSSGFHLSIGHSSGSSHHGWIGHSSNRHYSSGHVSSGHSDHRRPTISFQTPSSNRHYLSNGYQRSSGHSISFGRSSSHGNVTPSSHRPPSSHMFIGGRSGSSSRTPTIGHSRSSGRSNSAARPSSSRSQGSSSHSRGSSSQHRSSGHSSRGSSRPHH